MAADRTIIGLISDTHGLLRPEAADALRGCSRIIHAGDVGEGVLEQLQRIAPTTAVRGNTDMGLWAAKLRMTEQLEVSGYAFHVVHDLAGFPQIPSGVDVVVHGHSHRWSCSEEDGVWYINPGSAGPRRFGLPITLGLLIIEGPDLHVERIEID